MFFLLYLFYTTFSISDTNKGWCFPGEIPHLMWLIITGTERIHSGRMEMITIFNQSGKVKKPFHLWNLQFYHMGRRVCHQIKWDALMNFKFLHWSKMSLPMNFLKTMDETLQISVIYTPSPHITQFPLARFPLMRILAYVRASWIIFV